MKDLIKAAEAALDIVEKYNITDVNVQNKAAELKVSLDKAKEFQRNVGHLQRVLEVVNETAR